MQFLIAGAGQKGNHRARPFALGRHERTVQTLLAQLVEIRMADVLGGHVPLAIPLFFKRQRAEDAIG